MEAGTIIVVAMTAVLATGVDNLAILVALFARFRGRALPVMIGQVTTTAAVVVAAYFLGEAAARLPVEYVGLLGVVPLAIGLYWLYGLFSDDKSAVTSAASEITGRVVLLTTIVSLVGNSIDTLLTMTVLFADSRSDLDGLVLVGALAAALLLAMVARLAVNNRALGPLVERYSQRVAPFVMIAIGVYVLLNTATDILPTH